MIVAAIISLGMSAALCAAMIPLARRLGLVDYPGARKVHDAVTPLAGGPALVIVFLLAALYVDFESRFLQGLAVGGVLLFLTGLVDDVRGLPATVRFLLQIAACLVMVHLGEVRLENFGRLFRDDSVELGRAGVVITVFAAMGVINAFNLIDGMDGLAGTIFMVAAGGMALLAADSTHVQILHLLVMMLGAVLGFMAWNARLPWNRKARLFLGDSGSLLLGFMLAWCFIALGNDQPQFGKQAFMPITAVWLIAVPLLDTSTLIWMRWRQGRSAFRADQRHLQHAFVAAGFTVGQSWFAISLLAVGLAGFGLAFELTGAPDFVSFWTFLALAFAYYFYMRRSWARGRFLGRPLFNA